MGYPFNSDCRKKAVEFRSNRTAGSCQLPQPKILSGKGQPFFPKCTTPCIALTGYTVRKKFGYPSPPDSPGWFWPPPLYCTTTVSFVVWVKVVEPEVRFAVTVTV